MPLPCPPATTPTDPSAFVGWWNETGTAAAAFGLFRLGAMTASGWLVAVALATTGATGVPTRVIPRRLRPLLIASAMTTITVPPAAGATDAVPSVPTLVDLGPTTPPAPSLRDLGPIPTTDGPSPTADRIDIWVVESGDHLWHIAEETLRDHGLDPTEREVATYWREVIETNEAAVGANPDLIHPGQTIVLPPVQGV